MASGVRQVPDDRNLEKQMGCMAGFLQIFDRHPFIPGRRIYSPKRINSFSTTGSNSPSESSNLSAREVPEMLPSSPENLPEKILPFDCKEGMKNSWKLREAPRLSLDSRLRPTDTRTSPALCSADAYSDKNRSSPSVIARLMGLDALPSAGNAAGLQRSASESRIPRDLHRLSEDPAPDYAVTDKICKQPPQFKLLQPNAGQIQRRSYFDAQDFYPEPNRAIPRCSYGEIEKRLRMRGFDDPVSDLEALKQILEALQLKGLLRSHSEQSNLISDRPIVIMKPVLKRRSENQPVRSRPVRRNLAEEKHTPGRQSPRSPDPKPRRKPLNNQMNGKSSPRKMSPNPRINRRLNRDITRSAAEEDIATTNSDSSSLFDHEQRGAGRSLLERCDRLLNSIAEFTSTEQIAADDQQPSPVSVLDSSILSEDSSPSPVNKRSIDFNGIADWKNEKWVGSKPDYVVPEAERSDFAYVSNVIEAWDRYSGSPSDAYYFLEKRHRTADASSQSALRRRLIFDAVLEILDRKRHVSPWAAFSRRGCLFDGERLIREVWSEVRRSQDDIVVEDLNTSGEMSELVLGVERMVFKDLVAETITDLANLAGKRRIRNPIHRRKLLF